MQAYKGVFTANTGTGNQTVSGIVDEAAASFTPKALIIWTTFQTSHAFTDSLIWQVGLTDGTTQNSAYVFADDNTSPNDCDRARSATQIVLIRNAAGTNQRVGSFVSFGSGQFVINWTTTTDASALLFHYIALGGADLTAVCGAWQANLPMPEFAGIGYDTRAFLFIGAAAAGDIGGPQAIGWAANTGAAWVNGTVAAGTVDAQTTSITARYQRSVFAFATLSGAAGGPQSQYSFNDLGLGANIADGSANNFTHFLALGGVGAFAGNANQLTSTGNQALSGFGFSPKCALFMSFGNTATTSIITNNRMLLGACDRTRQGFAWNGNTDGVNPSVAARGSSVSALMTMSTPNATGSSTSTEASATLSSIDADGLTVNWGTADATAREYLYLALGDMPAGGGSPAPSAATSYVSFG